MSLKEHLVRTLLNITVMTLWILAMPLYIALYKESPTLSTFLFVVTSAVVILYFRGRYKAFTKRLMEKPEEAPTADNVIPIDKHRDLITPPRIRNRSSKSGEHMTPDEETWIRMRASNKQPECPDCGIGTFLEGPSGGICVNFKCSNRDCETMVNFCGPFGFERISAPSPSRRADVVVHEMSPPYR